MNQLKHRSSNLNNKSSSFVMHALKYSIVYKVWEKMLFAVSKNIYINDYKEVSVNIVCDWGGLAISIKQHARSSMIAIGFLRRLPTQTYWLTINAFSINRLFVSLLILLCSNSGRTSNNENVVITLLTECFV